MLFEFITLRETKITQSFLQITLSQKIIETNYNMNVNHRVCSNLPEDIYVIIMIFCNLPILSGKNLRNSTSCVINKL